MRGWLDTWQKPRVGESGGKGQVCIVRTHGFSSWVIRLFTGAPVNHMAIDTGTEFVSAEYPFVRTRPYGYFTNCVWSQFIYDDAQPDKIVEFAVAQLGKPYGTLDDIAIGVGILTKEHTPRWLARWLANNGEWICSSLADASLRAGGVHVRNDGVPLGAITPAFFWKFFADAGWLPRRIRFSKRI